MLVISGCDGWYDGSSFKQIRPTNIFSTLSLSLALWMQSVPLSTERIKQIQKSASTTKKLSGRIEQNGCKKKNIKVSYLEAFWKCNKPARHKIWLNETNNVFNSLLFPNS